MDLSITLTDLIEAVGVALIFWFGSRMVAPKDHDRAQALETIARGAAALVVSLNPKASWAELIKQVVDRIALTPGLPTRNKDAIERAAASALASLGKVNA